MAVKTAITTSAAATTRISITITITATMTYGGIVINRNTRRIESGTMR